MPKLNPGEFLDEVQELHALAIGFCEVIAFWPPRQKLLSEELSHVIQGEYHYYSIGRALGVLAWLGIAAAIKAIFF